jgi:hypothetical protein
MEMWEGGNGVAVGQPWGPAETEGGTVKLR